MSIGKPIMRFNWGAGRWVFTHSIKRDCPSPWWIMDFPSWEELRIAEVHERVPSMARQFIRKAKQYMGRLL